MDTKEIRLKFRDLALEHGKAYREGDYKKANKLHEKLHDLYYHTKYVQQMVVFGEFLNDDDDSVKLWAAIFTLNLDAKAAEEVLVELSDNSTIKMTAETTLQLWKEGKLNLI